MHLARCGIKLSRSVARAIDQGKPIVALESTIISHGMPYPANLEMAQEVESIIRRAGVTPATIACVGGEIQVGFDSQEDLVSFASKDPATVMKAATRDLPYAMIKKLDAATTVSATMHIAAQVGIDVFVTGGIGGVHPGISTVWDVSADLTALATTPVTVVCAGAKSILDLENTLEVLETNSVPVIGYNTPDFPAFFTRSSGLKAPHVATTSKEVANWIELNKSLELRNGMVVAVPTPSPVPNIESAIDTALGEVKASSSISGKAITPYLLSRVTELTAGASLASNIELVKHNATIGAEIALELASLRNDSLNNNDNDVLVFGGIIQDVIAKGKTNNQSRTSNVGEIQMSWGGVGRNITEALHRFGTSVLLVSAVGQDEGGKRGLEALSSLGINTAGVSTVHGSATATYSAILSSTGDLDVAVADTSIFNSSLKEVVMSKNVVKDSLGKCKFVILDGNFDKSDMEFIINESPSKSEIWYEPTSCAKAVLILENDMIKNVTYVSPSVDELLAMASAIRGGDESSTGLEAVEADALLVLSKMTESNNAHVIVTMGADGVAIASRSSSDSTKFVHIKAKRVLRKEEVVNCTGAGDTLVAGIIARKVRNPHELLEDSVRFAMEGAVKTLKSDSAIHPELSINDIID